MYHQFVDKFASFLHSAISSRIETIHTLARKYFWAVQRMVRARQRMPYLDFKVIKIFVGEAMPGGARIIYKKYVIDCKQ